jgi:hypothetical protein
LEDAFFALRRKITRNRTAMMIPHGYATALLLVRAGIMPRHSGAMMKYVDDTALMKTAGTAAIQ